jgi:hypothetical protein
MWRLTLLCLSLLLVPAFAGAQSAGNVNGLFPPDSTIRVTPWGPGISSYRDLDGNHVTVYELGPNQSYYSARDLNGPTSSGYIYNNWPSRRPLEPSAPSDYVPRPSDSYRLPFETR